MLVAVLLRCRLLHALRALRVCDAAWICLGASILGPYALADFFVALRANAASIRQADVVWALGVPLGSVPVGLTTGLGLAGLTLREADAAFLDALPIAALARRRSAMIAAAVLTAPLGALAGLTVGVVRDLIGGSSPLSWGMIAFLLFGSGAALGIALRCRAAATSRAERSLSGSAKRGVSLPWLRRIDRRAPTWLGAWAWSTSAGRMPLAIWSMAGLGIVALSVLPIGASLASHDAAAATWAAVCGGFMIFILSLRCRPLASPALRTAPIGFARVWFRLLRLPLVLSATYFVLPAGAALAAAPSAWVAPAGGGFWLLSLDFSYAVFAAYFLNSPGLAVVSFLAAVGYLSYESLEYGRTVLFAFVALVALLWHKVRQRFYRG